MSQLATGVGIWWVALSLVTVFNLGFWIYACTTFMRRRTGAPPTYVARWPHVLLSLGYVLGCGFRALLPRADVQRICLYDSWLSSVMVGRSVATVAELCFVAQWALLLREMSEAERDRVGLALSRFVFPMIVVAEVCSWYAVLTTNYLGNALEQSIWTLTAGLVAVSLFGLWRRSLPGQQRTFLGLALLISGGFVLFMCSVDVPMYLTRWHADQTQGRAYLSLAEGLRDVSERWVVTHGWQDWSEEISWMSLYFSFAVWLSIGMVHAPHWGRSAPQLGPSLPRSVPPSSARADIRSVPPSVRAETGRVSTVR
jgi:hypothetical protein